MNKVYKWLVFTLIVCISQNAQTKQRYTPSTVDADDLRAMECPNLVYYRDNRLFSDFKKAIDKYEIFSDVLELHEQNQAKVDTASNRFLASGAGEAYAGFMIAINTTAISIQTVVQAALEAVNPVALSTSMALKTVNTVSTAKDFVDKGAEETSYRVLMDRVPVIGTIINGISDIAENLKYMNDLPSAHKNAKAEFDKRMERLKSEISKSKNILDQAKTDHYILNRISNDISEKCNVTTADKSTEEGEKEKAKLRTEIQQMEEEIEDAEIDAIILRLEKEIAVAEQEVAREAALTRQIEQEVEAEIAAEMAAEAQNEIIWDVIEGFAKGFVEGYVGSNGYSTGNTGSQSQCAQVVAQINQYNNVLSEYERAGQGAMIRDAIQQNQVWYNNNCL
jgi:hypothetical protein